MSIDIRAFCNNDEALIVWRADAPIPECRGFELQREGMRAHGSVVSDVLDTYVGFAGAAPVPPGTHKPSTEWPVQRFMWRDYQAERFESVRYRVVPMLGPANSLQPAADAAASGWSNWVQVKTEQTAGFKAYFNRGVVACQWLTRRLDDDDVPRRTKLSKIITNPASPTRRFLAGQARTAILRFLREADAAGETIYAALYELNDPELIAALEALHRPANVILASGAFKDGDPDENAEVRQQLKAHGKVNVFDRLVTGKHFAHNKFVVAVGPDGAARRVLSGSTNWTVTGLCTQANNAIFISDPGLAAGFLDYWNRLRAAGSEYPASLSKANSTPVRAAVGGASLTAWLTPVRNTIDLEQAAQLIRGARDGVLFLMFNPGTQGTLLNEILGLVGTGRFVHGVINQDPGGKKKPVVQLVARGTRLQPRSDIIVPAAVSTPLTYWQDELKQYSMAMVHSKVVVVDPFGAHPVVMTGSHNLGPKASEKNDDNLVIVENAPGLATEYAVNIMSVFDQYKWRYNEQVKATPVTGAGTATTTPATQPAAGGSATAGGPAPADDESGKWAGLEDGDDWQNWFFSGPKQQELDFWLGKATAPEAEGVPAGEPVLVGAGTGGNH